MHNVYNVHRLQRKIFSVRIKLQQIPIKYHDFNCPSFYPSPYPLFLHIPLPSLFTHPLTLSFYSSLNRSMNRLTECSIKIELMKLNTKFVIFLKNEIHFIKVILITSIVKCGKNIFKQVQFNHLITTLLHTLTLPILSHSFIHPQKIRTYTYTLQ